MGTSFDAVEGMATGGIAGLADGLPLSYRGRQTVPRWLIRAGSGMLAGAAAAVAELVYAGPITLPLAAAVALVAVAALAGAGFGPIIRYGADLARVRRIGRRQVPVTAGR